MFLFMLVEANPLPNAHQISSYYDGTTIEVFAIFIMQDCEHEETGGGDNGTQSPNPAVEGCPSASGQEGEEDKVHVCCYEIMLYH